MKLEDILKPSLKGGICSPDRQKWLKEWTEFNNQYNKIYEGLICSQPGEYVVGKLNNQFKNWEFDYNRQDNKFWITIKQMITSDVFEQLLQLINNYGWFISAYTTNSQQWDSPVYTKQQVIDLLPTNFIEFQVEAKFDIETNKIPPILYHATQTTKVPNILKIGLTPKSNNTIASYPDRIYLAYDLSNLEHELLPHIAQHTNQKNWTILKIDTTNKNFPNLRLFSDPNYPYGYYTMTNIYPKCISIVKDIKL